MEGDLALPIWVMDFSAKPKKSLIHSLLHNKKSVGL